MLPLNAISLALAWHDHFEFSRHLYVLTHDLIMNVFRPFTDILPRSGLVRADRHEMDHVLSQKHSVFVMPGAARESFRPWNERLKIDLGGRSGFVAQSIRWGAPIVPVVTVGSHETFIVLARGASLAKWLGVHKVVRSADVFPLLAGLPWGVWALPFLPQLPLPAKLTTEVLPPIYLERELGRSLRPSDADDPTVVRRGFDLVLTRMRASLDALARERRFPILG